MIHEWQTATDPEVMLQLLRGTAGRRKLILLGVASYRRLNELDWFEEPRDAVRAAEMWVDGQATEDAVRAAHRVAYERSEAAGRMILSDPDSVDPNDGTAAYFVIEAAVSLVADIHPLVATAFTLDFCRQAIRHSVQARLQQQPRSEPQAQCILIRDIIGDPFRRVAFDPSWRTEAVVGLACGMYEGRDFTPMPVLADALEDAGCADADILAHCRGDGPHVRGCWVDDLVLGKT